MDRPIEKKRFTPRRIAMLAGSALLLAAIVYGFATVGGESTLKIESQKLTISEVVYGEFQEFIAVSGTIKPIKTFYLDAIQGGMVERIFLEEGSYVEVGDEILQLDNTDLHLDVMYREAQLFEQVNNLRNTRLAMEQNSLRLRGDLLEIDRQIGSSKREYDQFVELRAKDLISQNQFDQAKDEYDYWVRKRELILETQKQDSLLRAIQVEQLEASVTRMEENMQIVRQKLKNLIIKAPIEGHLTSLDAEVGVTKSKGTRIGQIDVLEGFKVGVTVDEYYISRVSDGQEGEVKIAGQTYPLFISKVYLEVRDGRFQIDMQFIGDEPEGIRRGQTVQIRLALGELSEAVMLARGGFYQDTGGNWVFVVDKSGDFAIRRKVSLGRYNTQVYEVLDGLEPGDKVITSSYSYYKDYERLSLKNK
ncbi:MAG: HlyD family efflux transporter periplasmic adaptor subunit [candidate division Zixibacteria bacterium]|nr:HlyD family efflux transporter periplasmic adaptor subunit [candidate division Zixibacteria bacterium]